jgi:heme/copper-type cytochrome/quinol oxidase subunit 2
MHAWVDGWGWFWMTLMMGLWVVLIGAVVYVAVRFAQRSPK